MSELILNNFAYPTIQINGQRITGPPVGFAGEPQSDIELFISNIPFDMFAPAILPIFAQMGTIYNFRLMMKISGMNRGFAYLRYVDNKSATRALHELHTIPIRYNQCMHVTISQNHRKLLLCKIRPDLTSESVMSMITGQVQGTERVELFFYESYFYASITYHTHRDAALARRTLVQDLLRFGPHSRLLWDRSITKTK